MPWLWTNNSEKHGNNRRLRDRRIAPSSVIGESSLTNFRWVRIRRYLWVRCLALFRLVKFPLSTRLQLALAGFIYRQSACVCVRCDVTIFLQDLDENVHYAANHFRKLHREKVAAGKKRCAFLLCQLDANIDDFRPAVGPQPQWDDAEHPEFVNYNARFETFKSWPHLAELNRVPNSHVTPSTMAKHGFFFSGSMFRRSPQSSSFQCTV